MFGNLNYKGSAVITPSDTVNLTRSPTQAIYVGVSGNISVLLLDGSTANLLSVPIGLLPVQALRVNATGTTATNLVALY
jgi:hypothetical protein